MDAAAQAGCRLAFVGPCPPFLAQVIDDRARVRGTLDRVEVTGAVDESAVASSGSPEPPSPCSCGKGPAGSRRRPFSRPWRPGVPVVTNLATAAEYPDGTVSYLPSADPDVVAARLVRAPGTTPRSDERCPRPGSRFAAAHQFRRLGPAR